MICHIFMSLSLCLLWTDIATYFLSWLLGISKSTVTEIRISADILEYQYNVKYCSTGKRAILLYTVIVINTFIRHKRTQ